MALTTPDLTMPGPRPGPRPGPGPIRLPIQSGSKIILPPEITQLSQVSPSISPVISPSISPVISPSISPVISPSISPVNSPRSLNTRLNSELLNELAATLNSSPVQRGEFPPKIADLRLVPEKAIFGKISGKINGQGSKQVSGNNPLLNNPLLTILNQVSLEKILIEKGMIPNGKIMVLKSKQDSYGKTIQENVVMAVRAVTGTGRTIFITVDDETDDALYITCSSSDTVMIELNQPSHFPLSERRGMDEALGMGISGVALVCDGDICILKKNDSIAKSNTESHSDGRIIERTFLRPDRSSRLLGGPAVQQQAAFSDKPARLLRGPIQAFPVIRYRDLFGDLNTLLRTIDDAATRINEKERIVCEGDVLAYRETIDELVQSTNNLSNLFFGNYQQLTHNIRHFSNNLEIYRNNPPQDLQNQEIYTLSLNGIRQSEEKLDELIQICNQLDLKTKADTLKKIIKDLEEVNTYLTASRSF